MNLWKTPALLILAVILATPAFGATYFVRPGGDDGACNGTTNADHSSGSSCAYRTIDKCDTRLGPGDTCEVQPGTYTQRLNPSSSGNGSSRLSYTCPSRNCVIRPSSGDAMDLRGKSHVTVDGFTFEDSSVWLWGNGSTQVEVTNIVMRDSDGVPPYPHAESAGGSDNTFSNFSIHTPQDKSAKTTPLSVGPNASGREQRTVIRNGILRGGWNTLTLVSCDDCVLDGVTFTGAENHTTNLCNGGNGCNRLTFKNCVFMASTGFREANPQVLGPINTLTVVNNAILSGWYLPNPGHETKLTGKITVKNNILFSPGTGSGETLGEVNNSSSVTWDVDHNAYVGAGTLSSGTPFWGDSRGSSNKNFYPDVDGDGIINDRGASDFDDWQNLGFDRNSIVFSSTDYRSTSAAYGAPLWGSTGPFWGAHVDCSRGNNAFDTHSQWGEAIRVGDKIEYEFDGVERTVTSVSGSGGSGNCDTRVEFSPALSSNTRFGRWFLSWGRTSGTSKQFIPQAGSPVIDAGDNAICGHQIKGARCDIGPVEYDPAGSDTQPPTDPSGLTALSGTGAIDLSWTGSTDDTAVSGYEIHRSTTQGSGYSLIGTTAATSWSDPSGTQGTRYYYVVKAYDLAGNRSGFSNEDSAVHPGPPPDTQPPTAPTNLNAEASTPSIHLGWNASSDNVAVSGYDVLRSTSQGSGHVVIGQTPTTTYVDSTALPQVTYSYVVQAYDPAGNRSGSSNESSATLPAPPDSQPPTAPAGLTATPGTGDVDLAWSASTDDTGVTGYEVLRSTSSGSGHTVIGTTQNTFFSDVTGQAGTTYFYVVRAKDAAGNRSAESNEDSAVHPGPPPDTQAPSVPSNVSAASAPLSVVLTWNASSDDRGVTGYNVLRSTSPGSGHSPIAQTSGPGYTDTTAAVGTNYYYVVNAFDAAGNQSGNSNESSATALPQQDTQPPSVAGNFSATPGSGKVSLDWNPSSDNTGVQHYRIHRSTRQEAEFNEIATSPSTSFIDDTVTAGVTYYYSVQAVDTSGNRSPRSTQDRADVVSFAVRETLPDDGDASAPCCYNRVFVEFSEPVLAASVKKNSFRFINVDTGQTQKIKGNPRVVQSGRVAEVALMYPMNRGTTYRLEIRANKGPKTLAMNASLGGNHNATFRTSGQHTTGSAPFEAASTAPADGASNVSTDTDLNVSFLDAIDSKRISKKSVKLYGPTGSKVKLSRSVSVSEDKKKVTFRPVASLATSSQYRLVLKGGKKGLRGVNGQKLPSNIEIRFTTGSVAASQQLELGVSD